MTESQPVPTDAFKVNSLTGLDKADPVEGDVVWDAPRSIWNVSMFVGAIVLAPLTFEWSAVAVFLVASGITLCAGHSVGFHRRLVHRSFECPKWLEYVLLWFGTAVGMGGPIWTIRLHDSRDWAQRQPDCHWFLRHAKPLLVDGFYYLNFRLKLKNPPGFDPGPDVIGDRFIVFLDKTWMLQQIPIAVALYLLGGWSWVGWGVFLRVSACTTMHWLISYYAHTKGPQDWIVDDAVIQAHNVPLLAIPTMGESWHNNHHAFPSSAKHGLYPGQIDLGWNFIQFLRWIGLAWNVKIPSELPPRPGISPTTDRAMSAASPGQGAISRA